MPADHCDSNSEHIPLDLLFEAMIRICTLQTR